uniref:Protein JTB n=1 Tax=Calidris pygmaea TaxID=425635 RepID=A0A8C3JFI6_9CHAR
MVASDEKRSGECGAGVRGVGWGVGLGPVSCRLGRCSAAALSSTASPVATTPCWRVEDFVVTQECARCSGFEAKTVLECHPTGFIEKISCATSKKEEVKSCRSAVLEAHVFWRFVGTMMCVAVVFAVLVVCRQRVLDRKALEKVRKQIESI